MMRKEMNLGTLPHTDHGILDIEKRILLIRAVHLSSIPLLLNTVINRFCVEAVV